MNLRPFGPETPSKVNPRMPLHISLHGMMGAFHCAKTSACIDDRLGCKAYSFPTLSPSILGKQQQPLAFTSATHSRLMMCVTSETCDTNEDPSYQYPCNTNQIIVTLIYCKCYSITPPLQKSNGGSCCKRQSPAGVKPLTSFPKREGGCREWQPNQPETTISVSKNRD